MAFTVTEAPEEESLRVRGAVEEYTVAVPSVVEVQVPKDPMEELERTTALELRSLKVVTSKLSLEAMRIAFRMRRPSTL
jgi:hypothetical protein